MNWNKQLVVFCAWLNFGMLLVLDERIRYRLHTIDGADGDDRRASTDDQTQLSRVIGHSESVIGVWEKPKHYNKLT